MGDRLKGDKGLGLIGDIWLDCLDELVKILDGLIDEKWLDVLTGDKWLDGLTIYIWLGVLMID